MIQRTIGHFDGFDLDGLWARSEPSAADYTEPVPSDAEVAAVEARLGHRLPDAYVELVRLPGSRNGGIVERCNFVLDTGANGEFEYVFVTGIMAIGATASRSLLGEYGTPYQLYHWEYPEIGVYFADTPSDGYEVLALDYRACGPYGEPAVVHLDHDNGNQITFVAPDFATFIRGLISDEAFDEAATAAGLE